MVFFGDSTNKSLSEGLSKGLTTPLYFPEVTVFPDGERRIRVVEEVVDADVVFLKTSSITDNVDSFIIETAFLIDAFKRSGAKSITGIIPYLPYCRADHVFRSGEAVPLEVIIHLLESAGLAKIVFVDPHTIKMPEMFTIDVANLSALSLFAEKIKEIGVHPQSSVIVSPDMGGLRRMEQLSEMVGGLAFTSIEKDRDYDTGDIKASGIHGDVKKTCFIVDDIISSGRTIVQAVDKLTELGAEEIYVFATHPVLSEDASKILQNSKAKKIFVTDAIPVPQSKYFEKLEVLSLSSIITSAF
ncbi:MAG: ribose-phosphate diphosphokinase [Candidatus Levybacteria bacterium]|nr:ribose-phosphate diphosphokinase [Candidatus Levybacteria bacterium]